MTLITLRLLSSEKKDIVGLVGPGWRSSWRITHTLSIHETPVVALIQIDQNPVRTRPVASSNETDRRLHTAGRGAFWAQTGRIVG